jgi:hypothetical protein
LDIVGFDVMAEGGSAWFPSKIVPGNPKGGFDYGAWFYPDLLKAIKPDSVSLPPNL